MKGKQIIIVLFFLLSMTLQAKKPAASVKVYKDTYFDETEINVATWLSYYSWTLENKGYNAALELIPDSNAVQQEVWKMIKKKSPHYLFSCSPYTLLPVGFFQEVHDPQHAWSVLDLPVTGLTYKQVVDFCYWRTIINKDNYIFRLPTFEEWKTFATEALSSEERKKGFKNGFYKEECKSYNFKSEIVESDIGITPSGYYSRDINKAFDVFGNVSEMLITEGQACGGNYLMSAAECNIDSIQIYTTPEKWLGFRCIAIKATGEEKNKYLQVYTNSKEELNILSDSLTKDGKYGLFIDKRDNEIYRTVQIGNQVWMAENLRYIADDSKIDELEKNFIQRFGERYKWKTAQNVCPEGYRLPSKEDFELFIENTKKYDFEDLLWDGSSGFSLIFRALLSAGFWSASEKNKLRIYTLDFAVKQKLLKIGLSENAGKLPVRCIKCEE